MAVYRANSPIKNTSERYEKLYTMLLNAIPSSVLLIDRDMRITSANRNFLEKSKRSILNTIGHRLEEVFPPVILDHIGIMHRVHQVFEKNQPTSGERITYRAPGLAMRVYYYRILPFLWRGYVENVILLMDDVTEQVQLSEDVRRVERHLASVVESASDIVLSTDNEWKIVTWNIAAEKISGYTVSEVKGHFFFDYCASDHQDVKKIFAKLKLRKSSNMVECNLVTKHSNPVPVSWVFSPMKNDIDQTIGIVAVGRDLTERRKLEMQLLQSQKLAALGVMAGGIAHEIRNPLAICSSAAQFLMKDNISVEFRKECAEKIHAGLQRASIIIENLLRFARPAAKTDITQVDLFYVLKETLALVANQAKIQKIEIAAYFLKEPVVINGIANLLQQMFMNIFLNAINAMPNGGLLNVTVEKIDSEILIRVTDTGHGITSKDISNIFDPFYTTSPTGKGTGLGLSICYSIVKQHFGCIDVDSVEGKGSTFTLRFPLP
ncbi:MAG: ATP-binding protein [Acidobacteriota bacterium]